MAYLVTPDHATQQEMRSCLQSAVQMPAPLMVALVTHWLETGVADRIITAIRNEAIGRQQLAQRTLKGFQFLAKPAAHHLWLRLPDGWGRRDVAAHLLRSGLAVVASGCLCRRRQPATCRATLARRRAQSRRADAGAADPGRRALQRPVDTRQIV